MMVGFRHGQERLPDGLGKHSEFRATLLLLENQQRLFEIRIAFEDRIAQKFNLRILAAETQYGGAGNIRMVNVTGQQSRKVSGIFASAAASAFMGEKLYAIKVGKYPVLLRTMIGVRAAVLIV